MIKSLTEIWLFIIFKRKKNSIVLKNLENNVLYQTASKYIPFDIQKKIHIKQSNFIVKLSLSCTAYIISLKDLFVSETNSYTVNYWWKTGFCYLIFKKSCQ